MDPRMIFMLTAAFNAAKKMIIPLLIVVATVYFFYRSKSDLGNVKDILGALHYKILGLIGKIGKVPKI
jgi:hypothetical protein